MKSKIGKIIIVGLIAASAAALLAGCLPKYDSLYREDGGPNYIAHRGLSSEFYQNSEAAYVGAGESEFFFGIETDVQKTADGKYVCAHDEKPFDDGGKKVAEINAEEALSLPLKKEDTGEVRLVTFERYLDICKTYAKAPIIEIKYKASAEDCAELVEIVKGKGLFETAVFISFEEDCLKYVSEADASAKTQLLMVFFSLNYDGNISVEKTFVGVNDIERAHADGKKIGVWTVNDKQTAQNLAGAGADYITTDKDFSKE